ncbi:hypothetical protein PRZ48_008391 [Zasmidium cellare]|uniref:Uncharacterized protein n=1 Tax=Zasmidium cellare TaxID=395010 RepID=A0ABR0EGD8_ZASCE|nr:hypothetical protein PRZ48_008391 [Zasmidium cellare]
MGAPHSTLSALDQVLQACELQALKFTGHPHYQRRLKGCEDVGELKFDEVFDFEGDGVPEYVNPKGIVGLRKSRTSLCLTDGQDEEAVKDEPPRQPTSSGRSRSRPDVTRNIALWLSSHAGESPLFEARFEAWFATHLEIISMHDEMKRATKRKEDWETCYAATCRLRKGLRRAYVGLRAGRESMGRGWERCVGKNDVCPKSWCQGDKIDVSDPGDVIKGCEELTRLKRSVMKCPVGTDLALPGVDISADVSLETALQDLSLMTTLNSEAAMQEVESRELLLQLTRSGEAKIQQALLDTEVVISLLCGLVKEAGQQEEELKTAFGKTMPDLESRWWTQMESLHVAAKMVGEDGEAVDEGWDD